MNTQVNMSWRAANWHYLQAAIATVCSFLEQQAAHVQNQSTTASLSNQAHPFLHNMVAQMDELTALEQLCSTFNLSLFERNLLLLCAGMELDHRIPSLCARAQGNDALSYPTFNLALATLPEPHWSALVPDAPLRRWQLIELSAGQTLTHSPLRIDERILHYLIGVSCTDDRTLGIIQPIAATHQSVASHRALAQQLANTWLQAQQQATRPIVQLCGYETASKQEIAATACSLLNWQLYHLSALAVPIHANDLQRLTRLWNREATLNRAALLIDCDGIDALNGTREEAIAQLIEQITSPIIIARPDRQPQRQRPLITFEIQPPTPDEQYELWTTSLGEMGRELNGHITKLVSQFKLSASAIQTVCTEAIGRQNVVTQPATSDSQLPILLWNTCRVQVRPRLDDLAQRIEPTAYWDDLVLPDHEKQILQSIAAQVRQRSQVYEHWGFRQKSDRGLGISALFAGVSGTGKTMSAEVLAQELHLDLYRIDLSSVVSKYIGETEKNLQRIFDAAECGAVILLFDEADALFGKRSDVKDSHDRYANMEVSYLLQRMEAYQGLAVLTTNLKDSLDTAFLRRLRFVVKFPFPDVAQRAEIWRRIFPQKTPTQGLDFNKLARLNVAGGNIRNIALNATFLAADANEPVQMKHLFTAAQSEYIKLERTLTEAEVKGWVV
jgi:hypothetical protein